MAQEKGELRRRNTHLVANEVLQGHWLFILRIMLIHIQQNDCVQKYESGIPIHNNTLAYEYQENIRIACPLPSWL